MTLEDLQLRRKASKPPRVLTDYLETIEEKKFDKTELASELASIIINELNTSNNNRRKKEFEEGLDWNIDIVIPEKGYPSTR